MLKQLLSTREARRIAGTAFCLLVLLGLSSLRDSQEGPSAGPGANSVRESLAVSGESPLSGRKSSRLDDLAVARVLQETGPDVFRSAAGLVYQPGSTDGHRLHHVMQHARDLPTKKIHGVFDGDREEILTVIDEAFALTAQGGKDVRDERQGTRRVVTVRLNRRIGYVGGEVGKQDGYPECRCVRIVLEGDNEVISAYPTATL